MKEKEMYKLELDLVEINILLDSLNVLSDKFYSQVNLVSKRSKEEFIYLEKMVDVALKIEDLLK